MSAFSILLILTNLSVPNDSVVIPVNDSVSYVQYFYDNGKLKSCGQWLDTALLGFANEEDPITKQFLYKGDTAYHQKIGTWCEYFENGQMASVASYNRYGLSGNYCSWLPDNTIAAYGQYYSTYIVPNSKVGKWYYYDNDGKIKLTEEYYIPPPHDITAFNELDGYRVCYYKSGIVKSSEHYSRNLLDGEVRYLFENGRDSLVGTYTPVKVAKKDSSGIILYYDTESVKTGIWRKYNADGKCILIEQYDSSGNPQKIPRKKYNKLKRPS